MPPAPKRAQAVFLAAVESDRPTQRADVLDRECGGDMGLRERVEFHPRAPQPAAQPLRSTDHRARQRRHRARG
jgi:hypothetical protein